MELLVTKQHRPPVVHFPVSLEREKFVGNLYGHFHPDSNEYNVVAYGTTSNSALPIIGQVIMESEESSKFATTIESAAITKDKLIGVWQNEKLIFRQGEQKCRVRSYELLLNIFSRNSGILETGIMLNKSVIISGCGSVGSLVAMELARAGVGSFLLVDNDAFAYHNICRHQCGISDVGKFKVNAVCERILQVNSSAKVLTQATILEEVPEKVFKEFCKDGTAIIGCADNRDGDLYANQLSHLYNMPFLSIGFWERAFAGEIFYSIPGRTPCYECVFGKSRRNSQGDDVEDISQRVSTNRRYYTTEEDLAQTRFEPGISVDINFVTIIGIKLVIDLLNLETPNYIPRLLNNLSQCTLVCNTNNTLIGGEEAEIFAYPLQVTTSIKVDYDEHCRVCQMTRS